MTSETQTQARNGYAEKLRHLINVGKGWPDEYKRLLDAALREQTRITVERIRRRVILASDDYSDDDGQYAEIAMADVMAVLDEVAALPHDSTPGEEGEKVPQEQFGGW